MTVYFTMKCSVHRGNLISVILQMIMNRRLKDMSSLLNFLSMLSSFTGGTNHEMWRSIWWGAINISSSRIPVRKFWQILRNWKYLNPGGDQWQRISSFVFRNQKSLWFYHIMASFIIQEICIHLRANSQTRLRRVLNCSFRIFLSRINFLTLLYKIVLSIFVPLFRVHLWKKKWNPVQNVNESVTAHGRSILDPYSDDIKWATILFFITLESLGWTTFCSKICT